MRMLFFAIVVVGCFALVIPGFTTEAKLDSSSASVLDESTEETRLDYSNFPIDDLAEEVPLYFEPAPVPPDFTEVEIPSDQTIKRCTMSFAWGDYDNDGDLDLAEASVEHEGNIGVMLYINENNELNHCEWFNEEFDGQLTSDYTSVAWGDYNNDGALDFALGTHNQTHVDYIFTNTLGSGDPDPFAVKRWFGPRATWSFAWGDYDNDGDIDLAVDSGGGHYEYNRLNQLYINRCMDNFRSVAEFDVGANFAWGDYDSDGDLDLVGGKHLYINNGDGTFRLIEDKFKGGHPAWGDFDNDGDLDLALGRAGTGDPETWYNYLYINNGDGTFSPPSLQFNNYESECERTWTVAWGDYDNDGDLDLAVGNCAWINETSIEAQNYLYINETVEKDNPIFTGVPLFGGISDDTNAIAWGDYDNDGDLDLAVGNKWEGSGGQQNYLYVNNTNWQTFNTFIGIHLVGHYHDQSYGFSNRDGMGAKVMVYERDHLSDPNYLIGFREINGNEGGGGMDSLDAEFGIPGPIVPDYVDVLVIWLGSGGRHIEEYWRLPVGQYHTLDEGSGSLSYQVGGLSSTVKTPLSFSITAIYPNPASDKLTCLLALPSAGPVELSLYDLSGRLVLEKRLEATEPTELEAILDVSMLASGVYTLQMTAFGTTAEGRAVIAR